MREIIKLGMGIEVKNEKGSLDIGFTQSINKSLKEVVTDEAFEMIKEKLEELCEIIADGITNKIEEIEELEELEEQVGMEQLDKETKAKIDKIMDKVQKEIESCNSLDDLLDLLATKISSL